MIDLSVVIASYSKTEKHRGLTLKAISTAKLCGITDIVVVETMPGVEFNGVTMVYFPDSEKFNYNKALNIGISHCKSKYIALCNNDIVFHKGFENIGVYMFYNSIKSCSPYTLKYRFNRFEKGNHCYYGYRIGYEMCGWCIVIDREILPEIGGKLDETYYFWFSDNAYADQLKKAGIKHAIMCNVFIEHLESQTLKTLPRAQELEYTLEQEKKYRNAKANANLKQLRKNRAE